MPASTIRLTPEVSDGIDRFVTAQKTKQCPNDVVNAVLSEWLIWKGILAPVDGTVAGQAHEKYR